MRDVSVIMPARNVAKTVARAVRSVLAEPAVLEVIVVEDGSDDTTPAVLEKLRAEDSRVVIVQGGNLGVTKGVNRGLEEARGVYFARCDADDWWLGDRLAWQRPFLEANPDYVAVSGAFSAMGENGAHVADLAVEGPAREVTEDLLSGRTVSHLCAMLVRMDAVRRIGGMREWFFSAQDMDMQCRLAEIGRVWHDPQPVLAYVLHDASVTHTLGAERRLFFQESVGRFAGQRRDSGADDLMRGTPPEFVPGTKQAPARSAAEHRANLLTGEAWRRFEKGSRREGLERLVRAVASEPRRLARWRSLGAMLMRSLAR